MAFPVLASLPFSFTKMLLPMEKKSSSLVILNSNFSQKTKCEASYKVAKDHSQNITRRSANFQPSVWTYDYIQSLSSEYKEMYTEQSLILKEEVRIMFNKIENEIDQLEFIDVLQRLGVAYHFTNEIKNILDNIYNIQTSNLKKNLYATALKFRLLRQHGYDISPDVFVCFQDERDSFKKCHTFDIEGVLSLYESSFHSFDDEAILYEARDFTSKCLKEYNLNQNRSTYMSLLVNHALELPLHWRIPRWESQWFTKVYERKQNMNLALLRFAKLDFNVVQSIFQEELKLESRWWNRTGLAENLNFARDRLVESFVWSVGTNFKPDFVYYREVMTKVTSFITTIDDVYDVHGTLEELELFTEAIDRWDLNAMDSLPDYMKICYYALYNFVNEVAFEILKKTGYSITPYLKKSWTDLCKAYLIEAKWYHSGYTPTFEEYIENSWISIGASVVLNHAYFVIPHSFKTEDLIHLQENTNIIYFSGMISRLANDLGTYKRENETGDIPKLIQCYMNKSGANEVEAREYVKCMMFTMLNKLNKEVHDSCFSQSFIDIAINGTRMALCMYLHGDGHTIQDRNIQNLIISLLFQPIPILKVV